MSKTTNKPKKTEMKNIDKKIALLIKDSSKEDIVELLKDQESVLAGAYQNNNNNTKEL